MHATATVVGAPVPYCQDMTIPSVGECVENCQTAEIEDEVMEKIVNIRPKAMDHLQELRRSQGSEGDIFLRMGVRSGGCSGLSYIMDLVKKVGQTARCPIARLVPLFARR